MDLRSTLIKNIMDNQASIANERRIEREIKFMEGSNSMLYSQPAARHPFREAFEGLLPPHLIPANVGDLNELQWDKWHSVTFDFGADYVYDNSTRQEQSFRVKAEAAFLVTRIYRDCHAEDAFKSPLILTLRDNQSSRQLNDFGIPVQAIPSKKGYYYDLEVPFLLYPAASISVELKCWLPSGEEFVSQGSSVQTFSFYGACARIVNPNTILKAMRLAK